MYKRPQILYSKIMSKSTVTRQELRRGFRKSPITRCGICGKRSTRHNLKAHKAR